MNALTCTLDQRAYRIPIRKPCRQVDARVDAKQLHLQLPDDDVGDIFIDSSNIAIASEQRERRRDEKTNQGDGHNPQRQRPFEIEIRRCNGFHSQKGSCHSQGPFRNCALRYTRCRSKESSRAIDRQFAQDLSSRSLHGLSRIAKAAGLPAASHTRAEIFDYMELFYNRHRAHAILQ